MNLTHLIDEYSHDEKIRSKLVEILENNWHIQDVKRQYDYSDQEVIAVLESDGRFTLYEGEWRDNKELFIKLDDDDEVEVESIDEYIENNQLIVHRDFTFGYLKK